MESVLTVTLPFFALIFVGLGAGYWRLLGPGAVTGLNAFTFRFALPCLLFVKLSAIPVFELFDWRFVVAYSGGGVVAYTVCVVLGRVIFRSTIAENGIQGMAAAFPNVGYIGLPLLLMIYGDQAALPAVIIIIFDHITNLPMATAMIEAGQGKHSSVYAIFRKVIVGLARNPLIVSTTLGILWGLTKLPLPSPAASFLNLMANAAGPTALFALGATLAGRPLSANFAEVALMCFCKLVVHPAVTAVVAFGFLAMEPDLAAIAVIDAALPIAANVYIMASAYNVYVDRASTAILVSTLISMFTVSALILLLGPGGAEDGLRAVLPIAWPK